MTDPVQAFESDAPSDVDQPTEFKGGKPKKRSYRGIVVAISMAAVLIGLMFFLSHVIGGYREQWAADRADKAKKAAEAANTGARGGHLFGDAVPAPTAAQAAPKPAGSPPAGGSGAIPLRTDGAPPPPPQGQAAAAPPPKPPQVSMFDDDSSSGTKTPAGGTAAQAASASPLKVVQTQAASEAKGQPATATPQATAANFGDRSYLLARGSWIPCILETQLNSTVAGATSCVIPENVYSDDGKVVLLGKGSHAQGTFGSTLKVGDERIAVMWDRIKTTLGIVVDVSSPVADGVGTTGAGGYVDNHWVQRIGAAVLLSFVQDAIGYEVAKTQNNANTTSTATNVYMPQNSVSSTNRLAEKILDSTINIPPTLYKNRGDRIMIYVNRDVWFDSTYKLVVSQ